MMLLLLLTRESATYAFEEVALEPADADADDVVVAVVAAANVLFVL